MSEAFPLSVQAFLEEMIAAGAVSSTVALRGTATEVEWEGAAGEARIGVPATPATRFDYASLTKPFVATLALALDAAGELPLALPIGEVWPQAHPLLARRPLADLLRHRSGVAGWAPLYHLCRERGGAADLLVGGGTEGDLLGARAGTYSDLGFILWGKSAERATGKPLAGLLRSRVLAPLGIEGIEATPGARPDLAESFMGTGQEVRLAARRGLSLEDLGPPALGQSQDGHGRFLNRRGEASGHAGLFRRRARSLGGSARNGWPRGACVDSAGRCRCSWRRWLVRPRLVAPGTPRQRGEGSLSGRLRAHRFRRQQFLDRSATWQGAGAPRLAARSVLRHGSLAPPLPPVVATSLMILKKGGLMEIRDLVLVDGVRTPMADYNGSFADVSAIDLAAHAARALFEKTAIDPKEIDQAIVGNALQTSPDAIYGARHVARQAGGPKEAPALTVNRLCGSGIQSVLSGAQAILTGDATTCLVGGMENMSQAPHVIWGARKGFKLGQGQLQDLLMIALMDTYCGAYMAQTSNNLARD